MKLHFISAWLLSANLAFAGSLPVITSSPQNQTVLAGNPATFSVSATGATSFQWRFNGTNLPGATTATLQLANAQAANVGYYMAVARNETGWVPSQMAYLSVGSAGRVPLSNQGNPSAIACYQVGDMGSLGRPITNATACVVAGPALDQMQPVGPAVAVTSGYFNAIAPSYRTVPTVAPGQTVFYRVDVTYPYWGGSYAQPSTVLQLVAGGGTYSMPSTAALKFPLWPEWPDPWYWGSYSSPTNQVAAPGGSLTLCNCVTGYADFGIPTIQWRKDGRPVTDPMSFISGSSEMYGATTDVLTLTNLQPADAGIYDAIILGNFWSITPKITLSIQFTNGPGILRAPRCHGTNFVCDLEGVASLNYAIQCSTNLSTWDNLCTLSNLTGTVTFTNALTPGTRRFYRALLLP
jgi:hypothetical protein